MPDLPLTGGCLCGEVRFELEALPSGAGYCHCTRCQRRTGTSQSAQAYVDGSAFELVAGDALLQVWRHPDGGFEKAFCRECGAHLFSRNPADHDQMAIRMSAFDRDPGVRPTLRAWLSSAAAWEQVPDDGLARYAESRP